MKALIAVALVVAATPLVALAAQDGTPSASNPPIIVDGQPLPNPPRQICRRLPAMSGSHVSRVRICRTAAEWRALGDIAVDDAMDRLEVLGVAQKAPRDGYTSSRGRH